MRRIFRSCFESCALSLLLVAVAAAEPKHSLKEVLRQPVGLPAMRDVEIGRLFETISLEIRTPVAVDEPALSEAGYKPTATISLDEPEQTTEKLLTSVLKRIAPEGRLCMVATTDRFGRIELLVTSRRAAEKRGGLIVPLAGPLNPAAGRISLEFEKNTLENGLMLICHEIDADLRLDEAGLEKAGLPPTRQFGVKMQGRSNAAALDELIKRFDPTGKTAYLLAESEKHRPVVVVSTRERLADFGPWASTAHFADIPEQTAPSEHMLWMYRNPHRRLAETLAKPLSGEPRQLPLTDALAIISRETKLPIEILTADLEAAEITRDQMVSYDPGGRPARAVLYDLLWQADPRKEATLVACIERRENDAFVVLVTTRTAANESGRSLLADYSLTPDDAASDND